MAFSVKKNRSTGNYYKKKPAERKKIFFSLSGLIKTKWSWPTFGQFGLRERVKKFFSTLALGAGIGGVLLGVMFTFIWLYRIALTSNFFATREIHIEGNVHLSYENVLEYAGINEGVNSLSVNIAHAEQKLRKIPWIEEVSVKRILPDQFVILIKERLPSFWIQKDGILYYANETGEIIAPVKSGAFLPLPILRMETGAEEKTGLLAQFMRDIKTKMTSVDFASISQILLSKTNCLVLFLDNREMRISIAMDDWRINIDRLEVTVKDLKRRNDLKNVREIQAISGNVWISFVGRAA